MEGDFLPAAEESPSDFRGSRCRQRKMGCGQARGPRWEGKEADASRFGVARGPGRGRRVGVVPVVAIIIVRTNIADTYFILHAWRKGGGPVQSRPCGERGASFYY